MVRPVSRRQEQTLLEQWLKQHGFTANPFAEREAGREKRLGEYFVPGPYYDEIKGDAGDPHTSFVFAARGCGKSAYRVMLEHSCRPWDATSKILAIPYTDFNAIAEAVEGHLAKVTLRHHIEAILREGTLRLFWSLVQQSPILAGLTPDERGLLRWLIDRYWPELPRIAPETASPVEKLPLPRAIRRPVQALLDKDPDLAENALELANHLADISPLPLANNLPAVQLLEKFVDLSVATGHQAAYILVDRVDEFLETAASAAACTTFLLPLVSNLNLLEETDHLAFKFYLPIEIAAVMRQNPAIRFDRLHHCELTWQDGDLVEMLRGRVRAFNIAGVASLGEIAAEEIAPTIDQELAGLAYGSPRRLLLLSDLLLAAHCRRSAGEEARLTRDDLKAAREAFEHEYGSLIPPLRIDEEQRRVFIGEREIAEKLTPLEYKFLLFLYQAKGELRSRDTIADVVYETDQGVSEEAIDSLVFRLRPKIERDPKNPVYLLTERGRGYRLMNAR